MRILGRPINTFLDVQRSFQDILGMLDEIEQKQAKTVTVVERETTNKTGTIRIVQPTPTTYDVQIMSSNGWLYYNGTAWVLKESK